MRKELFEENYMLLKKFIPELMGDTIPNFLLLHKSKISPYQNAQAERLDENLILVGTFYEINFDVVSDPSITILFCDNKRVARVVDITLNNPGMVAMGTAFYSEFDVGIDDIEKTAKELEANNYLNDWLKTFTANQENCKNYFEKIYIE
jgi:hypothetical protein